MNDETQEAPVRDTILKTLPVVLTNEELVDLGQELAEREEHLRESQQEKKDTAKAIDGQIKSHEAEILRLSRIIRARQENRDVGCEIRKDYKDGLVETVRTDTGEIVASREMTVEERQVAMEL